MAKQWKKSIATASQSTCRVRNKRQENTSPVSSHKLRKWIKPDCIDLLLLWYDIQLHNQFVGQHFHCLRSRLLIFPSLSSFWIIIIIRAKYICVTYFVSFIYLAKYIYIYICKYYTPIHNKMRMRMFPSLFTPENQPKVLLPETRVARCFFARLLTLFPGLKSQFTRWLLE